MFVLLRYIFRHFVAHYMPFYRAHVVVIWSDVVRR